MVGGSKRPVRILFAVVVGLCWLSAWGMPFRETRRLIANPPDFTPDFVTARAWVSFGHCGRGWPAILDRQTANQYANSLGAPSMRLLGPYYVHPPTALLAILPLVPLGYSRAVWVWLGVNLILLAALAWVLAPIATEAGLPLHPGVLFALLLFLPPTLSNIEQGQWSIALASTMALGHRAWERGNRKQGATWLAIATALKLTPVVAAPILALRDRKAAVRFALVLGGIVIAALPFGGVTAWLALIREAGPNTAAWQTYWHNTVSLNGLVSRLFIGGQFSQPWIVSPLAARAVRLVVGGTLLGVTAWQAMAMRQSPADRHREGAVMALAYLLVPIFNPLAWSHYALLLLLPGALAARAALARGDSLAMGLAMAGLALAVVPKEALYLLAEPFPSPAPRCAFLSVHLFAGLLVFAAAARGARGGHAAVQQDGVPAVAS